MSWKSTEGLWVGFRIVGLRSGSTFKSWAAQRPFWQESLTGHPLIGRKGIHHMSAVTVSSMIPHLMRSCDTVVVLAFIAMQRFKIGLMPVIAACAIFGFAKQSILG